MFIIDDQNDSNLLSSDHEVISHVLQEELGPAAYHERFASNMKNSRVLLSSDASLVGEPELSSVCFHLLCNSLFEVANMSL